MTFPEIHGWLSALHGDGLKLSFGVVKERPDTLDVYVRVRRGNIVCVQVLLDDARQDDALAMARALSALRRGLASPLATLAPEDAPNPNDERPW